MTDKAAGLTLTGERTLPGIWHENYWVFGSQRYAFVLATPMKTGRCARSYRHTLAGQFGGQAAPMPRQANALADLTREQAKRCAADNVVGRTSVQHGMNESACTPGSVRAPP
jgi:hypothetical protein